MQLRSIKIYCDVVDRRSFSKAAADNGMSQSAASQMIQHIEERVGVRLIDRSKRPFVVTPEGECYYEGCRKLLRQYLDLEERVHNLHEQIVGTVTVAAIYSVGLAHMGQFVQEFSKRYPKSHVRLEYHHPDRVYEVVARGDADLGLVSYPRTSNRFGMLDWRTEPMVLVCPPDHPLASRNKVPLEALRGERFVSFEKGLRIREEIDHELMLRNVEIETVHEFDNIETMKRAIESGAGVSILPLPTVEQSAALGTLRAIPFLKQKIVRPLGIIFQKDEELNGPAEQFIRLLREDYLNAPEPTNGTLPKTKVRNFSI